MSKKNEARKRQQEDFDEKAAENYFKEMEKRKKDMEFLLKECEKEIEEQYGKPYFLNETKHQTKEKIKEQTKDQIDRILREEQDADYQESLLIDQIKKQSAIEKKQEEERLGRERIENREKRRQSRIEKQLSPEPNSQTDSIALRIRMPDNSCLLRRFQKSDPFHMVFDYIESNMTNEILIEIEDFLLVSNFPKREYFRDQFKTLEEASFSKNMTLFVEASVKLL